MPVQAPPKVFRIHFVEKPLAFSDRYPPGLAEFLSVAEFDAVLRRINVEMAEPIRERAHKVRILVCTCLALCAIVVGVFGAPVMLIKTNRQRRELKRFWIDVREYLTDQNRRVFSRRNIEWKLVEEKHRLKGRDVINPMLAYRIEIIVKSGSTPGRIAPSRQTVAAIPITSSTVQSESNRLAALYGTTSIVEEPTEAVESPMLASGSSKASFAFPNEPEEETINPLTQSVPPEEDAPSASRGIFGISALQLLPTSDSEEILDISSLPPLPSSDDGDEFDRATLIPLPDSSDDDLEF